jgi:hypothetical protein
MRLNGFGLAAGLLVVCLGTANAAESLCKKLDVTGTWKLRQANGPTVELTVVQDDGEVVGTAKSGSVLGTVKGGINERSISLRIKWKNNTVGIYLGDANDEDIFSGVAFEEKNKENSTSWKALSAAECKDED